MITKQSSWLITMCFLKVPFPQPPLAVVAGKPQSVTRPPPPSVRHFSLLDTTQVSATVEPQLPRVHQRSFEAIFWYFTNNLLHPGPAKCCLEILWQFM